MGFHVYLQHIYPKSNNGILSLLRQSGFHALRQKDALGVKKKSKNTTK